MPANLAAKDDRYVITYEDAQAHTKVTRVFHDAADTILAFPPALNAAADIAATSPYVRPKYTLPAIAGATGYRAEWRHTAGKQDTHSFAMDIAPAWLSGPAPYSVDFPDLSTAPGWNAQWTAPSNAAKGSVTTTTTVNVKTTFAGGYEEKTASKVVALP